MRAGVRRHTRGFVLLVALVLLALAGVVMAEAARRSSAVALQARMAQVALQARWGTLSLQTVLLPQAEKVLQQAEATLQQPQISIHRQVQLADMTFDLIWADEQAKANVNALYARKQADGLVQALRRILAAAGWGIDIQISPIRIASSSNDIHLQPFESLHQLLGKDDPALLLDRQENRIPLAATVTCWGDGRLNFQRADLEVLQEMAEGTLSIYQQSQILSLRREIPNLSLQEACKRLELADTQAAKVAKVLTDESSCYSLRIVAGSGQRSWYQLAIGARTGKDGAISPMRVMTW